MKLQVDIQYVDFVTRHCFSVNQIIGHPLKISTSLVEIYVIGSLAQLAYLTLRLKNIPYNKPSLVS